MIFDFDETTQLTIINLDKDDICSQCYEDIREVCPLLSCFLTNNAYPCAGSLQLIACCMYEYIKEQRENKQKQEEKEH